MADPGFLGGGRYHGERERIKGVWEWSPQWAKPLVGGPGGKAPEAEEILRMADKIWLESMNVLWNFD